MYKSNTRPRLDGIGQTWAPQNRVTYHSEGQKTVVPLQKLASEGQFYQWNKKLVKLTYWSMNPSSHQEVVHPLVEKRLIFSQLDSSYRPMPTNHGLNHLILLLAMLKIIGMSWCYPKYVICFPHRRLFDLNEIVDLDHHPTLKRIGTGKRKTMAKHIRNDQWSPVLTMVKSLRLKFLGPRWSFHGTQPVQILSSFCNWLL